MVAFKIIVLFATSYVRAVGRVVGAVASTLIEEKSEIFFPAGIFRSTVLVKLP